MEKRGFTFLFSWAAAVGGLPAEVRLELYDAIIKYAQSGMVSQLKPMARLAFGFIRKDIDAEFDGCERESSDGDTTLFAELPETTAPSEEEKEREKAEKAAKKAAEMDLFRKVDYLYGLYPASCFRGERKASTGKCSADKRRLARLLQTKTAEEIEAAIRNYVSECGGSYLKNFSTFLNNMPEPEAEPTARVMDNNAYKDV